MPPEDEPPSKPLPNEAGYMSTAAKLSLADIALALRDEQLEAKVIHYRADLDTNPDLDAITAQVVEELRNLQAAVRMMAPVAKSMPITDRATVESDLIQSLWEMLSRIFREDRLAPLIERKLGEVAKRFRARVLRERARRQDSRLADRDEDDALLRASRLPRAEAPRGIRSSARSRSSPTPRTPSAIKRKTKYFAIMKDLRNDFPRPHDARAEYAD